MQIDREVLRDVAGSLDAIEQSAKGPHFPDTYANTMKLLGECAADALARLRKAMEAKDG